MIDIYCYIFLVMDDGVSDLVDSIEMVRVVVY